MVVPDSVAQVLDASLAPDFSSDDLAWDPASEVRVALSDSGSSGGAGVSVEGSTVTITRPGTYRVSGTLTDGQLAVDGAGAGVVRIVLDQAAITNSRSSALVAKGVDKLIVLTAQGTENTLTDATAYVYPDDETEPDAALFSTVDTVIGGEGELAVNGRFADAVASKDGLVVAGGTLDLAAVDDGLRGRDYLVVSGGKLTVASGGQGLKSTNDSDEGAGYVLVSGGSVDVTTGGTKSDCVNAVTNALFTAGTMTLSCTDDGVHADKLLMVDGGDLTIANSYEGLESAVVVVSGGRVDVTSADDGINATDGSGSGGGGPAGQRPGGAPDGIPSWQPGAAPGEFQPGGRRPADVPDAAPSDVPGGFPDAAPGAGTRPRGGQGGGGRGGGEAVENATVVIRGGEVSLNSGGDGLDSNGTMSISGGVTIASGANRAGDGALDSNGAFLVSGGTVAGIGSTGMLRTPDEASPQEWFSQATTIDAGDKITIKTNNSTFEFTAAKPAQNIVFTSPDLASGGVVLTVGDAAPITPECHGG